MAGGAQEQWVAFASAQQEPQQPLQESTKVGDGEWRSLEPVGEPWYVGRVTRQKAESLLQYDGDFLVRASTQQPNQFVLSGMQNGKKRHLLLVNPDGQVCARTFFFPSSLSSFPLIHLCSLFTKSKVA